MNTDKLPFDLTQPGSTWEDLWDEFIEDCKKSNKRIIEASDFFFWLDFGFKVPKRVLPKHENLATKFAMWFIVNWEFHDDTDKGQTYRSIYDGKTILPIAEIYDRWLLNDA